MYGGGDSPHGGATQADRGIASGGVPPGERFLNLSAAWFHSVGRILCGSP